MSAPRTAPGTVIDDDQPEDWRARAEKSEEALYQLADAWPVLPGWCWFVLGLFIGIGLSEVWPWL